MDGFGKVILLEYVDPLYNLFYDMLKIVDENTMVGKAFFGKPTQGSEIMAFSMSRKYPFEFMTKEDHKILYNNMRKPAEINGRNMGRQIVSDFKWSEPLLGSITILINNE